MPDWISKWWITWLFGVVTAILSGAYARLSHKFKKDREASRMKAEQDAKEMKALKDGMRSILRRQIIYDCEQALNDKFCPVDKKRSIEDMYNSFEAFGKEVAIEQLKNTVINLPTFKS